MSISCVKIANTLIKVSKYLFATKVKELQNERKNKPTNYIEVTVTN